MSTEPLAHDPESVARAYAMIFEELVPEAIGYFRSKSRDYQSGGSFLKLGSRAQFVQLDRKHVKLQQSVWDGQTLEGEQPEEIIMDQIGHCFLMLACLRLERRAAELAVDRKFQGVPNIFLATVHEEGCRLDKDHYGPCKTRALDDEHFSEFESFGG